MNTPTPVGQCLVVPGDCVASLQAVPDDTIPLVVTSPPYDNLRVYNGYQWDFAVAARELYRVLHPGGVMCWVVGDAVDAGSESVTSAKQKIFFREECGFLIHDTMIYGKTNPGNPSDGHKRYNQMFEYVFVLSKGRPAAWNPLKDKPNVSYGKPRFGNKARKGAGGVPDGTVFPRTPAAEFGLRGNIWIGPTAAQEKPCQKLPHPAQMPEWLARDLITSWSNPGDIVLDPFAGGGTVGVLAETLGRHSIMMELSPEYCDLIAARVAQGA